RCPTRRASVVLMSTPLSWSTSSPTTTSTARRSASTAPSAWRRSDPGARTASQHAALTRRFRPEGDLMSLAGKTILMSGGSRGIGLAIALRAAADGANIVLLAKTDSPHPKLEGTVHTAAEAIRAAGGQALPIVGDVRNDD